MQPCRKIWRQSWRCFSLATRVSYPVEVNMKAIEMRLAGIPVKEVMEQLGIRNKTQVKSWMKWYRNDELNRLEQPGGKQYSYGKGPEYMSELEKLKTENRFLKQQLDVLKKYKEMERRYHKDCSEVDGVYPRRCECNTSLCMDRNFTSYLLPLESYLWTREEGCCSGEDS